MKKNQLHKMYLVLGDWSDDGHGKSNKVLLESNVTVDVVQQAYKDSCKLTGVSFNHNEDYTEKKNAPLIATEYEDSFIPSEAIQIFREKFGLTQEIAQSWFPDDELCEKIEDNETICLYGDAFVNAWIWFVRLSHPEIQIKTLDAKDEIPCINGYWNDNLNVQFGYGLYN